jgi:membrane-bound serine protease (ClpP class)
VTGVEGMVGLEARARDPIGPDAAGYIDVHGEMWRAVSRDTIPAGHPVRVIGLDGLTLVVEPSGAAAREGA